MCYYSIQESASQEFFLRLIPLPYSASSEAADGTERFNAAAHELLPALPQQ